MGWIIRILIWGLVRRFLGIPGMLAVGALLYAYFKTKY